MYKIIGPNLGPWAQKSTLRFMRTLGPSSAALAQSSWSLLLMALVTSPFLGRITSWAQKSTLRFMRTLGPSSAALAQSCWSLLLMALVTGPFLGRIASCYDHLNFSRAFVVHFRASRYIRIHKHTPKTKVMAIWICQQLPCSNSSVSIYYTPESNIRVKSYDRLNFSRASVVHFRAFLYIIGLTHTPESKVMVVWICRELTSSISSVSIYHAPESEIRVKVMTIWISWELPLLVFERLEISWASHMHPSKKLWMLEFSESFRVQFQASRYIMHLNRISKWKLMTI